MILQIVFAAVCCGIGLGLIIGPFVKGWVLHLPLVQADAYLPAIGIILNIIAFALAAPIIASMG